MLEELLKELEQSETFQNTLLLTLKQEYEKIIKEQKELKQEILSLRELCNTQTKLLKELIERLNESNSLNERLVTELMKLPEKLSELE